MTGGSDTPRRRAQTVVALAAWIGVMVAVGGVAWAVKERPRSPPPSADPPTAAAASPAIEASAPSAPPPPKMLTSDGVTYEDDPVVKAMLDASVRCGVLRGGEYRASLLDLLRLRSRGVLTVPIEYQVRHESRGQYDYVVIREHARNRDGSDLVGLPGYVDHRYLYDDARERFELVRSQPENDAFDPRVLAALGNPLGFLALHWEAVCNGKLAFLDHGRPTTGPSAQGETYQAAAQIAPRASPAALLLVKQWDAWNDKCRGGDGDDPETDRACDQREILDAQLKDAGMCYGHIGEFGYQRAWHVCGPRSCRLPGC